MKLNKQYRAELKEFKKQLRESFPGTMIPVSERLFRRLGLRGGSKTNLGSEKEVKP